MIDALLSRIDALNNPTVVGLDPTLEMIPSYLREEKFAQYGKTPEAVAEMFLAFNRAILAAVQGIVPAVKPQIAFYERYGLAGLSAYEKTAALAKEMGFVVIGDIKRGDIGSTAAAYAAHIGGTEIAGERFDLWHEDFVTVNPYLGIDGIQPFIDACNKENKGIFVLVKTSNPSSSQLQDIVVDGKPVYLHVAALVDEWGRAAMGASGYSRVCAVVGAPHELHELFRKIGEFRHEAESVIIIGGGRIAERLALELARMHIHSTIIERDPARCRVMKTLLPEATIICADGTKPDVLHEEGLTEADALVTLTESDETNLIISSFAHHENVPKIVTKVDEDNFIQLAESYGLTTIIQPADVTAGRIVEYVRWMQNSAHSSGVETLRMVADGQAEALEFRASETTRHLGETLLDIQLKPEILIACITHKGRTIIPRGSDVFQAGDTVIVVGQKEVTPFVSR